MSELKLLLEAVEIFVRFKKPWYVAGGWAIDLHAGRISRAHADVDLLVLRCDQSEVQALLKDCNPQKVLPHPEGLLNCGTLAPWRAGEHLELPIHQVSAERDGRKVEVMFGETSGDEWLYRRNPTVRHPLLSLGFHSPSGIPYLAPEIVLLFKSKHMRSHDRADFETALPMLAADARKWLRDALEKTSPGHEWAMKL